MTPTQRRLLERVARRDSSFGNQNVNDPAEGARCDEEVRQLQVLKSYGWITLALTPNGQTPHGRWHGVGPLITEAGRRALAEPD